MAESEPPRGVDVTAGQVCRPNAPCIGVLTFDLIGLDGGLVNGYLLIGSKGYTVEEMLIRPALHLLPEGAAMVVMVGAGELPFYIEVTNLDGYHIVKRNLIWSLVTTLPLVGRFFRWCLGSSGCELTDLST